MSDKKRRDCLIKRDSEGFCITVVGDDGPEGCVFLTEQEAKNVGLLLLMEKPFLPLSNVVMGSSFTGEELGYRGGSDA